MTKKELVKKVSEMAGVTQAQTNDVLKAFIQCVRQEDKVQMSGFGTFKWKLREARTGRNPTTGAKIQIPEKTVLTFQASKGE